MDAVHIRRAQIRSERIMILKQQYDWKTAATTSILTAPISPGFHRPMVMHGKTQIFKKTGPKGPFKLFLIL